MIQNYIFDFYGTLVDIHTDEERPLLWKQMADFYHAYGADYTPLELKKEFHVQCADAENALRRESGYENVEIDLAKIFWVLMRKAPVSHRSYHEVLDIDEWSYETANIFRVLSRTKLKTFPHTIPVLKKLKKQGSHIFILSNAQESFTMPEMEQSGILPYIDGIYISSVYKIKKPEKDFLARLMKKEKLKKEESIMIGNDCYSDVASAVKNQMHSVFLDTGKHNVAEREKMIRDVCKDNTYAPYVIEDGDIRKILDIK